MSFQQGLSGLNTTSRNLEIIGNNIANANTYGAKSARAEFADLYANAANGSNNNIGIGVVMTTVAQQFTQGGISTTENPLDLAINGQGFFQLSASRDAVTNPTYSRNGQFKVDKDGYILNNQNQYLMGIPVTGGSAVPLSLPTQGIAPRATTELAMQFNLDGRAENTDVFAVATEADLAAAQAQALADADPTNTVKAAAAVAAAATAVNARARADAVLNGAPAIDFSDTSTYNKSTSVTVFDAMGLPVALTFYFQKAGDPLVPGDEWNVYATANGASVSVDGAGNPTPTTTINFTTGANPVVSNPTLSIPASVPPAAAHDAITLDLDMLGATQYGSSFAVTSLTQDGYAPGDLVGVQFEKDGSVTTRFSNGQTLSAGQLQLATFRNQQGLQPVGGNGWKFTAASGNPVLNTPGVGNTGALQAGALEESNVDLTGELVNMITAQRSYQANAQTIKTQDQVLQTLVNLR